MDISRYLLAENKLDAYISLTHELKSSICATTVVDIRAIHSLQKLQGLEIEYFMKFNESGASLLALETILREPSSNPWNSYADELVDLLKYWLEAVQLFRSECANWWKFLKRLLELTQTINSKNQFVKHVLLEKTSVLLLQFATDEGLELNQRLLVVSCLNKCVTGSSEDVRHRLSRQVRIYLIKLSRYMRSCGHIEMQLAILESLLQWLAKGVHCKRVAALEYFSGNLYTKPAKIFMQRNFEDFVKDSRDFLRAYNEINGNVVSTACKKFTFGELVVSDQEGDTLWLDLNIGAKCLSLSLTASALDLLGVQDVGARDVITFFNADVAAINMYSDLDTTIEIEIMKSPELLYENTKKLSADFTDIKVKICPGKDMYKIDHGLSAIFHDKYKHQPYSKRRRYAMGTRYNGRQKIVNLFRKKITSMPKPLFDSEVYRLGSVCKLPAVPELKGPGDIYENFSKVTRNLTLGQNIHKPCELLFNKTYQATGIYNNVDKINKCTNNLNMDSAKDGSCYNSIANNSANKVLRYINNSSLNTINKTESTKEIYDISTNITEAAIKTQIEDKNNEHILTQVIGHNLLNKFKLGSKRKPYNKQKPCTVISSTSNDESNTECIENTPTCFIEKSNVVNKIDILNCLNNILNQVQTNLLYDLGNNVSTDQTLYESQICINTGIKSLHDISNSFSKILDPVITNNLNCVIGSGHQILKVKKAMISSNNGQKMFVKNPKRMNTKQSDNRSLINMTKKTEHNVNITKTRKKRKLYSEKDILFEQVLRTPQSTKIYKLDDVKKINTTATCYKDIIRERLNNKNDRKKDTFQISSNEINNDLIDKNKEIEISTMGQNVLINKLKSKTVTNCDKDVFNFASYVSPNMTSSGAKLNKKEDEINEYAPILTEKKKIHEDILNISNKKKCKNNHKVTKLIPLLHLSPVSVDDDFKRTNRKIVLRNSKKDCDRVKNAIKKLKEKNITKSLTDGMTKHKNDFSERYTKLNSSQTQLGINKNRKDCKKMDSNIENIPTERSGSMLNEMQSLNKIKIKKRISNEQHSRGQLHHDNQAQLIKGTISSPIYTNKTSIEVSIKENLLKSKFPHTSDSLISTSLQSHKYIYKENQDQSRMLRKNGLRWQSLPKHRESSNILNNIKNINLLMSNENEIKQGNDNSLQLTVLSNYEDLNHINNQQIDTKKAKIETTNVDNKLNYNSPQTFLGNKDNVNKLINAHISSKTKQHTITQLSRVPFVLIDRLSAQQITNAMQKPYIIDPIPLNRKTNFCGNREINNSYKPKQETGATSGLTFIEDKLALTIMEDMDKTYLEKSINIIPKVGFLNSTASPCSLHNNCSMPTNETITNFLKLYTDSNNDDTKLKITHTEKGLNITYNMLGIMESPKEYLTSSFKHQQYTSNNNSIELDIPLDMVRTEINPLVLDDNKVYCRDVHTPSKRKSKTVKNSMCYLEQEIDAKDRDFGLNSASKDLQKNLNCNVTERNVNKQLKYKEVAITSCHDSTKSATKMGSKGIENISQVPFTLKTNPEKFSTIYEDVTNNVKYSLQKQIKSPSDLMFSEGYLSFTISPISEIYFDKNSYNNISSGSDTSITYKNYIDCSINSTLTNIIDIGQSQNSNTHEERTPDFADKVNEAMAMTLTEMHLTIRNQFQDILAKIEEGVSDCRAARLEPYKDIEDKFEEIHMHLIAKLKREQAQVNQRLLNLKLAATTELEN